MRRVAVGDAIMVGFRLIGREPMAFLVWTLIYGVIGLGPQLLMMGMGFNAMAAAGSGASTEDLAGQLAPLQGLQPLSIVAALVSSLVIYSAVMRAVLFPEERGFAFLRADGRLLWMAIAYLAVIAISVLGVFALVFPVALAAGFGAAAGGPTGVILVVVLGLAMVAAIWAGVRLTTVMAHGFARRTFRLPDAWRMTRGQVWPILGAFLVLVVLLLIAEMLLLGVAFAAVAAAVPLDELTRAASNPVALFSKVNPAVWAVGVALWALFGTWTYTIFSATGAEIYRQLTGPDTSEVFA